MEKNIVYILIILLSYSCDFTSAEEYFNQARDLEEKGEFEQAIILLDKAIEKKSNFRPALLNRGADKSDLGDFKGAIEDYYTILEFDIDNTMALVSVGNNFSKLNEHEKAIYYYSLSLKTKGALESLGLAEGPMALYNNPEFNKFDSDADYNMLDCVIHFYRGTEYLTIEQFDNAISDFNKSIKANHRKNDCYNLIGQAYIGKNDSINACGYFFKTARIGDAEGKQLLKKYYVKR